MPPILSQAVRGLLAILGRGAEPRNQVRAQANAGNRHGTNELLLPVSETGRVEWVPVTLLRALEEDSAAPWSCGLALRYPPQVISQMCALAVTYGFTREFFNAKHPDLNTGRHWHWPEQEIAAAQQRARAFLEPSLVIDARCSVVVLWGLRSPIDLRRDGARAIELLQRLAHKTGAIVPAGDVDLGSLSVPIPGFGILGHPADLSIVRCTRLDVDRTYDLKAIDAALRATSTVAPAAPRRAHREEPRT